MGYISAMGLSCLTDYPLVVHLDHAHSVIDRLIRLWKVSCHFLRSSRNQNLEDRTIKLKMTNTWNQEVNTENWTDRFRTLQAANSLSATLWWITGQC